MLGMRQLWEEAVPLITEAGSHFLLPDSVDLSAGKFPQAGSFKLILQFSFVYIILQLAADPPAGHELRCALGYEIFSIKIPGAVHAVPGVFYFFHLIFFTLPLIQPPDSSCRFPSYSIQPTAAA